jgi:hypothetical protein
MSSLSLNMLHAGPALEALQGSDYLSTAPALSRISSLDVYVPNYGLGYAPAVAGLPDRHRPLKRFKMDVNVISMEVEKINAIFILRGGPRCG